MALALAGDLLRRTSRDRPAQSEPERKGVSGAARAPFVTAMTKIDVARDEPEAIRRPLAEPTFDPLRAVPTRAHRSVSPDGRARETVAGTVISPVAEGATGGEGWSFAPQVERQAGLTPRSPLGDATRAGAMAQRRHERRTYRPCRRWRSRSRPASSG